MLYPANWNLQTFLCFTINDTFKMFRILDRLRKQTDTLGVAGRLQLDDDDDDRDDNDDNDDENRFCLQASNDGWGGDRLP